MIVTVIAEADSRRDADLGLAQQFLGELQRTEMSVGRGDLGPDVHRGLGVFHHPAQFVQALDQDIAPLPILLGDVQYALLVAFQGGDGSDLQRGEGAVVVVALDPRQGVDQFRVADHKADAPAGHVVALGQGEELHGYVLGSRHLHDRGGLPAVVDDVGIGQVVDHQDIVLLGQGHHALEEIQLHALGGGVGRKAQDHHLRLGNGFADGPFQFGEEIHARYQGHRTHLGAGDHRAIDVDGVAGVGHQHGIAMIQGGEHQVRQAFLGAYGDYGFAFRVDLHLVAIGVPARDGPAQAWDAAGGGVAVGVFALCDLHQLLDYVRLGGPVRIAHAEVDDVLATAAGGHLQFGGDIEYVGGQAIDARKTALSLFSHVFLERRKRPEPSERRWPLRWPAAKINAAAGACRAPSDFDPSGGGPSAIPGSTAEGT